MRVTTMPENWNEFKVIGAIIFASIVKWLMTEEVIAEDEKPDARKRRLRKAFGGILAGVLVGYFGHPWVISKSSFFTTDDTVIVAIALTITGEHIVRSLMTVGPQILENMIGRSFKGGSR